MTSVYHENESAGNVQTFDVFLCKKLKNAWEFLSACQIVKTMNIVVPFFYPLHIIECIEETNNFFRLILTQGLN